MSLTLQIKNRAKPKGMEVILYILGFIVLILLLSLGGWILQALGVVIEFIAQGLQGCFGCSLQLFLGIIAILAIIAALVT